MFNLNKVYATISFDIDEVKIYVHDQQNNNSCLYYNSRKLHNVFLENYSLTNDELLKKTIYEITRNCDDFLKNPIRRYILNFTNISLNYTNFTSKGVEITKTITKEDCDRAIEKEILDHEYCPTQVAQMKITKWSVDGIEYLTQPIGVNGGQLSFTYSILKYQYTPQLIKIIDTFKKIKLEVIDVTVNALALGEYQNAKNALIVDIRKNKMLFSFFDGNSEFIKANYVDVGYENIVDKVFECFDKRTRNKIINSYNSIAKVGASGFNPIVVIWHMPEFLRIKSMHANKLIDIFKSVILAEFKKVIESYSKNNNDLLIEKTYVHANSDFIQCVHSLFANDGYHAIVNGNNTIVNDNITEAIGSIQLAIKNQEIIKKQVYSINPYVSDVLGDTHIKKQMQMKLGMMAINFVAKLGESYGE